MKYHLAKSYMLFQCPTINILQLQQQDLLIAILNSNIFWNGAIVQHHDGWVKWQVLCYFVMVDAGGDELAQLGVLAK